MRNRTRAHNQPPRQKLPPHQFLERMLFEFSYWHEMNDDPWKPQAYALASEAVGAHKEDVERAWKDGGIKALKEFPGIGEQIAKKMDEYFRTGRVREYASLKKKFPVDIWGLSRIEGLGPKRIFILYKKLKVKNLEDLERVLARRKVRDLIGFGEKSEQKLANGLALLRRSSGRHPREEILPIANLIVKRLTGLKEIERVSLAGSIRRKKPDVGDIDIVATSDKPKEVMAAFTHFPEIQEILEIGPTRASVRLAIGIDCDLRVVRDEVYGAALQYLTGDKRHNIILRELALKKGYKLNEYGLFKGKKMVACRKEEDIYKKLGLKTPPPETRIGRDEFVAL